MSALPSSESSEIQLEVSDSERELFQVLVAAASSLPQLSGAPDAPPPTVRIVGGWVRDRLLSSPWYASRGAVPPPASSASYDVDVALSSCTGLQFAEGVAAHLRSVRPGDVPHVGVVSANPDKSKHLETATCRLYGFECDFVNLREEEYADGADHRVPTEVRFGTPAEDAARRDFTVNALFYRLHSDGSGGGTVEDWT
eukprot:CAMPEP_0194294898 /NCGR_PEP_ID=MMETSP0169-20130528/52004_1 /TAXON_ID=218684 /ORGANISM="Corethron pennatum, Strain L29A3" /LENGTH=197 /DNA_ID=CAMNT_0039043911 /DNA_START=119 /DNA_END=708 /DNA_ORIENTATION=+